MIPELGKYALWVLAAYGVSLTLLVAIVVASLLQARRALRDLQRMEEGRVRKDARTKAPGMETQANG